MNINEFEMGDIIKISCPEKKAYHPFYAGKEFTYTGSNEDFITLVNYTFNQPLPVFIGNTSYWREGWEIVKYARNRAQGTPISGYLPQILHKSLVLATSKEFNEWDIDEIDGLLDAKNEYNNDI